MSYALTDSVVIVTGGSRGMGAAHCRRFAAEGAKVVIADVDQHGEKLARELVDGGMTASFQHLDVSSAGEWERVTAEVVDQHERIDVLVNNAGILQLEDAVDCSEETWQRTIDVNQKGAFLGMKHIIPVMRRHGGGSIVNVSSLYGLVGAVGYIAYCASKGAVTLMTKAAAVTHGPENIRVNSVHPGVIFTEMLEAELKGLGEGSLDDFLAATPLRRGALPDEVSSCVLFLASSQSSFVTGIELVVDGGLYAGR